MGSQTRSCVVARVRRVGVMEVLSHSMEFIGVAARSLAGNAESSWRCAWFGCWACFGECTVCVLLHVSRGGLRSRGDTDGVQLVRGVAAARFLGEKIRRWAFRVFNHNRLPVDPNSNRSTGGRLVCRCCNAWLCRRAGNGAVGFGRVPKRGAGAPWYFEMQR